MILEKEKKGGGPPTLEDDMDNHLNEFQIDPDPSPACLSPQYPMSPTRDESPPKSPPVVDPERTFSPYFLHSQLQPSDYIPPDPKNPKRLTGDNNPQTPDELRERSLSLPVFTFPGVTNNNLNNNIDNDNDNLNQDSEIKMLNHPLEQPFGSTSATKGASCFLVKERKVTKGKKTSSTLYRNVVLAIDINGITLLQPFTETTISHHPYREIKLWKHTPTFFYFLWYPNPKKDGVPILFETRIGDDIMKAIHENVNRILVRRRQGLA